MIFPPALRPGDLVAIVAPSSPFDEASYRRGAAWLASRYRLQVRDDLLARRGYLAGDDTRRGRELHDALHDPQVRAVLAARGGYGAMRLLDSLDWSILRTAPKWLVGFSDITALHVEAARMGVASLHAPMVTWLGDANDDHRGRVVAALESGRLEPWRDLECVVPGEAEGPAFGGNIAMLAACAAAGTLHVPDGAVVLLEDCTERPYRLDRMLTSLRLGGHLARAAAIVVGDLTDCSPGPDGTTAQDVIRERLSIGIPLFTAAPFGHGARNEPFIVGGAVELRMSDGRGILSFVPVAR